MDAGAEKREPGRYEVYTTKIAQVFPLYSTLFEIEGHYADYDDELSVDWKVAVRPQREEWEFMWWEADENYSDGLSQFQTSLFEDRLTEHLHLFFDRWTAAMNQLTTIPKEDK